MPEKMSKPRFQWSRVPACDIWTGASTVYLFGTIVQEEQSLGVTKELFKLIFFGSVPQRPWWGFVGGIPQNTSFTRDESPLAV